MGFYPIIYLTGRGEVLCAACASEENDSEDPVVVADVYWEGPGVECENCYDVIESAYGDPDESGDGLSGSNKRDIRDITEAEFKKEFLDGAARAIFVLAYADYVEENPDEDLPYASNGADWYDIAPDTPKRAYTMARALWKGLEQLNGQTVFSLAKRAAVADRKGGEDLDFDPWSFGGDIAMEYAGTGVSWFDRHGKFDLRVPRGEVHADLFLESDYAE